MVIVKSCQKQNLERIPYLKYGINKIPVPKAINHHQLTETHLSTFFSGPQSFYYFGRISMGSNTCSNSTTKAIEQSKRKLFWRIYCQLWRTTVHSPLRYHKTNKYLVKLSGIWLSFRKIILHNLVLIKKCSFNSSRMRKQKDSEVCKKLSREYSKNQ